MDQGSVKIGLALCQGEFDVTQAAVTEHGHEDVDPPPDLAQADAATLAPIHLQSLARLPVHLLIDPATWPTDLPHVTPHQRDATAVTVVATTDLFQHADRRQLG